MKEWALLALLLAADQQIRVLDEGVVKGMASQVNCTGSGVTCTVNSSGVIWTLNVPTAGGNGTGGAPISARYVVTAADPDLTNEVVLPTCTGSQVLTFNGTSVSCTTPASTYTLPIASDTVLGSVKVGASHTIDGTGVLDNYLPTYTRAAAPACGATWLSREIRVHDAAQEDQTWVIGRAHV